MKISSTFCQHLGATNSKPNEYQKKQDGKKNKIVALSKWIL
jgi:hypothetical protein